MAITNRRPFVLAIGENSVALQNYNRRSNSFGSFASDIDESGIIQSFELPEGMHLWSEVGRINIFVNLKKFVITKSVIFGYSNRVVFVNLLESN